LNCIRLREPAHAPPRNQHPFRPVPTTDIYPFNLSVFHNDPRLVFDTPITFFVGENGSGKSTLLRAITRACGIHIWSQVEKRRFDDNPNENDLHKFIDVSWNENSIPGAFFSAELFNYFARSLDDWASGDPGLLEYFGEYRCLANRTVSRYCRS